jgi:pyridoxine 5-phosphate synthase
VPERREEVTTEGGLAVAGHEGRIEPVVAALRQAGIRVSLFIEPDPFQVAAAADVGAQVVEFHTGRYCHLTGSAREAELRRLVDAARQADAAGLEVHAGHGLDYETAVDIVALPHVRELNIGHFLIGEAVFVGLEAAVRRMRAVMDAAA